ncbi:hypothetical protein LOCC1_G002658 [Lachnellula occidentalis]|uniref:Uncharacterized protein n=1 Tax=Lachnellula occidentalis TaxID=215460 RepID=A0A8H8SA93_9HELO|nr:hypothetical protein LOCC1_G002658 [Lachnellula occidentalis]
MAISDNIQTVSAAFSFGILLQAASGALFIYYQGRGPNLLQDGRRLVLLLFLLFAALWAQFSFFNLMIPSTAAGACQALLVFTTMFDQLARVGVEQFLLWAIGQGTKSTVQQMILQGMLGARLIAGGLLVGFTRPDFAPVCVARTSVLPASIVVLTLDVIIMGVLLIRASSLGMFSELGNTKLGTRREQSRAVIFSIAGFTAWTGTSVPMILGIQTMILILRTTLPSMGLLVLVGIVILFQGGLLLPREEEATTPEARSPFVMPNPPSRQLFRENVGNGSPVSGHNYTKSGDLFVVNPSSTPRDSPTPRFQNNFQGDTRGFTKLGAETNVRYLDGDDHFLSLPNNAPGYRGSSGVFPSILATQLQTGNQIAMPPQIRPAAVEGTRNTPVVFVPTPTAQQKRSLFGRSKPSANMPVRSLAISNPVLEENVESVQPFARMPTIDLATAASNERERREVAATKSRLVATRPAPQPPSLPPAQEGLRRSISLKRKEMITLQKKPMPTIPSSNASELSVNGSSTSASLSPGREEVRRRSPRNMHNFNGFTNEKQAPVVPALQRKVTIGLPTNPRSQRITLARETRSEKEQTVMFINDIVYDDPGMVDAIMNTAPTEYASTKHPKATDIPWIHSKQSPRHSIIHRPRPYKRDSEQDRAIWPSEPSPRHKRSKSGSSLMGRKSMLMGSIGSPTQLPPLPPPPTSASKLKRLLPNDTKSMTFDEKIELLFPSPPGASSTNKRRSSVPSLPRVPSVFMSDTPHVQSPIEEGERSRRTSKRTTIASFELPNVNEHAKSPKSEAQKFTENHTYRFSANTYRDLADDVGETPPTEMGLGMSVQELPKAESESVINTRQKSAWTETTASISSSSDEARTFWGSLHSEIPPVNLSIARQTAKPTLIQQGSNRLRDDTSRALPLLPPAENEGDEIMTIMFDSGEARRRILSPPTENRLSFKLDAGQTLPGDKTPSPKSARAWHRRVGDELPTFSEREVKPRARKMPPPTPLLLNKNGRQATVVVRNTEPSPIDSPERALEELQAQLKRFEEPNRGSVGSIIRHLPNGSAVEDGDLLEDHGFQLLDHLEKEMGQQENQWQQMQTNIDRDSFSTIMSPPALPKTDLSRESSQRSSRTPSRILSRRARIRNSLTTRSKGEDSTSTTSTSSSDNSRASIWQQRLAEAQEEYLENAPVLLRNQSLNFLSVAKSHQIGSPTPPDSEESGTEIETDAESESEAPEALRAAPVFNQKQLLSLWKPTSASPDTAEDCLWSPSHKRLVIRTNSPEPPARDVRPVKRRSGYSPSIYSSTLWSNPKPSERSQSVVGLWGFKPLRTRSIKTRPVTQRPQRKSKRVTFLPDIIENPLPLPNKRDTLGIFQFPWGEKSDSAVYQPAFNPALLAGPVINTKLQARSHQLEPDSSEYSSSFFDEYDEEHDDDPDPDPESDDDFDETTLWEIASLLRSRDVPSRDSLLPPSRQVESRDIIEDYDDDSETEFDSDSDYEDQEIGLEESRTQGSTVPATKFSIKSPVPAPREVSQLWTGVQISDVTANMIGLPQPEDTVWGSFGSAKYSVLRPRTRVSENLPELVSHNLWIAPPSATSILTATSMWSLRSTLERRAPAHKEFMWQATPEKRDLRTQGLFSATNDRVVMRTTKAEPAAINMLRKPRSSAAHLPMISSQTLWSRSLSPKRQIEWTSKPTTAQTSSFVKPTLMWARDTIMVTGSDIGLFDASIARSDYRSTVLIPTTINITCKPRMIRAPLSKLESTKLWCEEDRACPEHHWISESSIRPDSPSVYSSASSGESSPSADDSSVKSNSTKASSIWNSIGSAATWWESKSRKKSPSHTPVDDPKHPSKIPLRPTANKAIKSVTEHGRESNIAVPVKHLVRLRESRFIVSEDLAETKAPVLESTPSQSVRTMTSQSDTQENWGAAPAEAPTQSTATSHTARYDPSMRHPVFFTGDMTTTTNQIHPAAIGHVSIQKSPSLLWATPSITNALAIAPLWSKGITSKHEVPLPVAQVHTMVRKAPVTRTFDLPSLESSAFWQPTRSFVSEHNWLIATKVKSQTWASRGIQSPVKKTDDRNLWMPQLPEVGSSDMFANVRGEYIKKASTQRLDTLQSLESSRLFEPTFSTDSHTHWLHATSKASGSRSRSSSPETGNEDLWTPAYSKINFQGTTFWTPVPTMAPQNESSKKMWESPTNETSLLPALFPNPHAAPWEQKKRQPLPLKTVESTTLWRLSMAMPESPKDWLVGRRVSRVESRY